jgi:hypothetical protein
MLPKGFKLAAKNEISKEVKEKNKVYISHHTVLNSTFVVGPIAGKLTKS